jgi:Leucine-rich repeat (LRR) protein
MLILQEIPETIGNLKQLVTLKLDDNQLTTLPKTIGNLCNLEEFILSQNDFESLPPCIGLLRKLNILNVDDNMLEELPPGKTFLLSIPDGHRGPYVEVPPVLQNNIILPSIRHAS